MKAGQHNIDLPNPVNIHTPIPCFLLNNKKITFQADMADKSKFKFAAFLSMGLLFSIYFPTAASGYLSLGDCVEENVINGLSDGALKKADHLISIRMAMYYISADLGVNLRIIQNRPNCLNQLMSQLYERQTH